MINAKFREPDWRELSERYPDAGIVIISTPKPSHRFNLIAWALVIMVLLVWLVAFVQEVL